MRFLIPLLLHKNNGAKFSMKSDFTSSKRMTFRRGLQWIFAWYVVFLSYLLIIDNPFAVVPIDEELVENGFGLCLTPHLLSFLVLSVLGFAARFRRPGWLYFGMFLYAGGTELLQGALSPWLGRCCDLADFVENVQGLLFGGAGWWLSHTLFRTRHSKCREKELPAVCDSEVPADFSAAPDSAAAENSQENPRFSRKSHTEKARRFRNSAPRKAAENWAFGKNARRNRFQRKRSF